MVELRFDKKGGLEELAHTVSFKTDMKTIQELVDHYDNGRLELEPAFQRRSVWRTKQRKELVRSLYENVPIPSIFLHERDKDGETVYDVIDGKQRIESILMFLGKRKPRFPFKAEWTEEGEECWDEVYWSDLADKERSAINRYPIQTITVKGSVADIAQIFVRINSTGSKLTRQEVRHADYMRSSEFLRQCQKTAESKAVLGFFLGSRILSQSQVNRMRHIELVSELVLSIHDKGPINKKKAIEDAMSNDTVKGAHLEKVLRTFKSTLKTVSRVFPSLRKTRFRGVADFYTIFMLVWRWRYVDRLVLTDKKRNQLAESYLSAFGFNVDRIREKQRKLKGVEDSEKAFAAYLHTVQSATDDISTRKRRQKILEGVLSGVFEEKDPFRSFSEEQKRIIWFLSPGKCSTCGRKLRASGFHVDHIRPHARGGKTSLKNAQVLCPPCNRAKGDKILKRKTAYDRGGTHRSCS